MQCRMQHIIHDVDATQPAIRTDAQVAFATSDGVAIISPQTSYPESKLPFTKGKEQMTVRFSPIQPTLFCGDRTGKVVLTDLRSMQSVFRLGHSSATHAIRVLNESLVLVHGLTTTSIYDLRYAKAPSIAPQAFSTSGARSRRCFQATTPYLSFAVPTGRRSDRYGSGFAYSPEMNIVAAASSNNFHGHHVTLYSASTGRPLPGYSKLVDCKWDDQVTCLDFARIRDGPVSLISKSGQFVDEWTPMYSKHRTREEWENSYEQCTSSADESGD